MDKKILKIFFSFVLTIALLSGANFVSALEVHYPTIWGHSLNSSSSFGDYFCYLFGLGTSIAIFISVLSLVFGGLFYLISFSRGKFTDEAKDWIKASLIGLLIVLCSTLIGYAINPNLTKCDIGVLSIINTIIPSSPVNSNNTPVTTFKEIPIGTLTENLLTREISCYEFDSLGNPIDQATVDSSLSPLRADNGFVYSSPRYFIPTYLSHDRVDCLVGIMDAAQKKAQVIASLSDNITKLMNTCSCAGKCDDTCGGAQGCNQPTHCPEPAGYKCTGACTGSDGKGAACKQPQNGPQDCCPTGVKDKIEHGDIDLPIDVGSPSGSCLTPNTTYKGLDEFRCPNPISNDHASCDDLENFLEVRTQINGKPVTIISQDNWQKLNLLQQLTYLRSKIDDITKTIQNDKDLLDQAKTTLNSCYLAIPYVDLVKTYQYTDSNNRIIITDPETFNDPVTNKPLSISNYCTGFNYKNSSCLQKCNDSCPDNSPAALSLYRQKTGACDLSNKTCLDQAIKDAYNLRPCIYGTNTLQTFSNCISSCQNDCSNMCSKKYLPCSNEYNFCNSQCDNNSQCVLNNSSSCLFNSSNFQQCANQNLDQGNVNYCINNAYLCKNGSNEYAGYQDCANPPYPDCSSLTDENLCRANKVCSWNSTDKTCFEDYSASFFYTNKNSQKCPDPLNPPTVNSVCASSTADPTTACATLCPETSKCPASSNCPSCSCDQLTNPNDPTQPLILHFSVPNKNTGTNTGNEGYSTQSQPVLAYQMVGPQCDGYSHNDDPLTFYCQDSWWTDPNREGLAQTPMGNERVCPTQQEIPVGETVDNAENWSINVIKNVNKVKQDIQPIIDQIIKVGKAKDTDPIQNYCKCGAKFDNNPPHEGEPICKSGCQYSQTWVTPTGGGGGINGGGGGGDSYNDKRQNNVLAGFNYNEPDNVVAQSSTNTSAIMLTQAGGPGQIPVCACTFSPCKGNPCQQVSDYLADVWNYYRQFKIDFIDFYTTMVTEPRSDIMKELTYSRQATNTCSIKNTASGPSVRLLDCTRVEDELIPPINTGYIDYNNIKVPSYCYGTKLGVLSNQSLTDNWFCCEEWSGSPTLNNNPIYNIQQ